MALNPFQGICETCGEPLNNGEDVMSCGLCHTPHHVSCWKYAGCTTFGCQNRKETKETLPEPYSLPKKYPAFHWTIRAACILIKCASLVILTGIILSIILFVFPYNAGAGMLCTFLFFILLGIVTPRLVSLHEIIFDNTDKTACMTRDFIQKLDQTLKRIGNHKQNP